MALRIEFVTLFPEMVLGALGQSMMERAEAMGAARFGVVNPRDFCYDRHNKVDDTPYGGEPGMLIRVDPVAYALESIGIKSRSPRAAASGAEHGAQRLPIATNHEPRTTNHLPSRTAVILTAPTGQLFTQALAKEFAELERIVFLCGHYEGFDHRVETQLATHVVSIGDYVLTNGELPALIMTDAIVRLLPNVLGSPDSLSADSHADGLLSAPNYTKPELWRGEEVPEVLRNGNHQAIQKWRRKQSLIQTRDRRPDLLARAHLEKTDLDVLSS